MEVLQDFIHPFQVAASKEYLMEHFAPVEGLSKIFTDVFASKDEIDFIDFTSMGLTVANVLNEKFRVEDHKKFVNIYNEILRTKYQKALSMIDFIYNNLAYSKGAFIMLNKPNFEAVDATDIFKGREFKNEHELERILYESLLNWDLKWSVKRQRKVGNGLSDITILKSNEKVAIELKKGVAQRKDVYQTLDYTSGESGYLGVLIASGFDANVIELANQSGINCYEYQIAIPSDGVVPQSIFLESMNGAREKTLIEMQIEDVNLCDGHIVDFLTPFNSKKTEQVVHQKHKQVVAAIKEWCILAEENLKQNRCECCGTILR